MLTFTVFHIYVYIYTLEVEISRYILLYIKYINNKDLLYSTRIYIYVHSIYILYIYNIYIHILMHAQLLYHQILL